MTLAIYQIQYSNKVVGGFDPAFLRYDCRNNPEHEKREVAHMQRFFSEGIWKREGADLFGLLSPKFNEKAGISGDEFKRWILNNPGYDVYFINPFPQLVYFHFNVWEQGEYWHPGLKEMANLLFNAAGIGVNAAFFSRNCAATALYSNYWVGNKRFWQEFIEFVDKMTEAVDGLPSEQKLLFFSDAPHYSKAVYFPFVFERLFSTFIATSRHYKVLSFPYDMSQMLHRCSCNFEREMLSTWAPMIDSWDRQGRDDIEVRTLFRNLEAMQRFFSQNPGDQGKFNGCAWLQNPIIKKLGIWF